MTAIVSGATGFIGTHLVDRLVESGQEVRCLVRRAPADPNARARYEPTDFSLASLGVDDSVFQNVDTIYHLAGATRAISESAFHEANVSVTERVLDRAIAAGARNARFVYVSSQAAAGPSRRAVRRSTTADEPLTESDAPAPIEPYGRSKLAAERAVLARGDKIPVTIVRPVAVYGPRDRDFLSIFRMTRRGIAVYPGIRDAVVTTIYVDDLVRGMISAAASPRTVGNTYFIGSEEFATWRAIYSLIARTEGKSKLREIDVPLWLVRSGGVVGDLLGVLSRRPPLLSSSKAALAAPRSWLCSSARAKQDFGFVASTRLQDGLRATYDWYVNHHWL
jgi:nucleoside-diphosphate-sugar epimerase